MMCANAKTSTEASREKGAPRWRRAPVSWWPVLSVLFVLLFLAARPVLGADAPAEGEESMAAKIQQFLKTSAWALGAFAIVLFVLWKKLFPPVIQALDERAAKIKESLEAAERAKSEAERLTAENEQILDKARAEGREIIEEARQDAERVKQGIVSDARKESEEIVARGRRELEQAKQTAVDDLYRQASRLSFDLAEKIIQKSLKPEDHKKLIDSCIESYKKSG